MVLHTPGRVSGRSSEQSCLGYSSTAADGYHAGQWQWRQQQWLLDLHLIKHYNPAVLNQQTCGSKHTWSCSSVLRTGPYLSRRFDNNRAPRKMIAALSPT